MKLTNTTHSIWEIWRISPPILHHKDVNLKAKHSLLLNHSLRDRKGAILDHEYKVSLSPITIATDSTRLQMRYYKVFSAYKVIQSIAKVTKLYFDHLAFVKLTMSMWVSQSIVGPTPYQEVKFWLSSQPK